MENKKLYVYEFYDSMGISFFSANLLGDAAAQKAADGFSETLHGERITFKKIRRYNGYGYHGGGRPPLADDEKAQHLSISGRPQEIELVRKIAAANSQSVSRYLLSLVKENAKNYN